MNAEKAAQVAAHMRSIVSTGWTVEMRNTERRPGFEAIYKVVAEGAAAELCIVCRPTDELFYVWGVPGHAVKATDFGHIGFKDFQAAWDALVATITRLHTVVVKQYDSIS